MTTLAVIKKDEHICMATDSQATLAGRSMYDTKKIFVLKPFVIGVCGEYRVANIIESSFFYHINKDEYELDAYYFMQTIFIDRLRDALKINGVSEVVNYTKEFHGAMLLVIYKDRIFEIGGDFCVVEIKDYTALGSGGDFALGALSTLLDNDNDIPVNEVVIESVHVAMKHDIYSGGNVQIFDSDNENLIPDDEFFEEAEQFYAESERAMEIVQQAKKES